MLMNDDDFYYETLKCDSCHDMDKLFDVSRESVESLIQKLYKNKEINIEDFEDEIHILCQAFEIKIK